MRMSFTGANPLASGLGSVGVGGKLRHGSPAEAPAEPASTSASATTRCSACAMPLPMRPAPVSSATFPSTVMLTAGLLPRNRPWRADRTPERDGPETGFEAESGARRPKAFVPVRRVESGVRQRTRDRGSMGYMVSTLEPSAAVVVLAAMATPALRFVGGVTP